MDKKDELMDKWFEIMDNRKPLADELYKNMSNPITYRRKVVLGFSRMLLEQARFVREEMIASGNKPTKQVKGD